MDMNTVGDRRDGAGAGSALGGDDTAGNLSAERWEVDPARSSLEFNLRHIVVQQIRGRFERWGGTLFIDHHQPWLSSVQVWVDLASVTTDDPARDAHVRSSEFLDVARFPRAEFKSTNISVPDGQIVVEGRLSIHGVVHDVEMRADVEVGEAMADSSGPERACYTARGVIDRQSFGLHWNQDLDVGGIVVGDEVEITAKLEVIR
jgi:polyisoprenoid-binding protein YceI